MKNPKNCRNAALFLMIMAGTVLPGWSAETTVHHELYVRLEPATHRIQVVDQVSLDQAAAQQTLAFTLHEGLEISGVEGGRLSKVGPASPTSERPVKTVEYRIELDKTASEAARVVLRYQGNIYHPLEREEEYARSFSSSPGLIGEEGVFLAGSSAWVPAFGDHLVSFRLRVDLPETWDAVSQGRRVRHEIEEGRRQVVWDSPEPMDEIYLAAAPFVEYSQPAGAVTAYAFLRTPEPNLAAKYLEATAQYIDLYTRLIGPYPYAKFALVENFWETGYGMPSFTLLGSTVIRLPFIINSSYPHEILHNWWGNSVFVDYASGNWCEGLTAYLADFLIKEGQGQGADYRRDALKRYRNFVRGEKDFPLNQFRVRHSPSTEAVGYGKSLMLWHMLRLRLGDDLFRRGLQTGFRRHRFQRASFSDWEKVFSEVSGEDVSGFFGQWVDRVGAPELAIGRGQVESVDAGYRVRLEVLQRQEGSPYQLKVPLAFTLEGQAAAEVRWVELNEASAIFEGDFSSQPLRVDVDPAFDLFRRLHRSEIPASIGQIFGSDRILVVLPGGRDEIPAEQWRQMVEAWGEESADRYQFVTENELGQLPSDRSVWILGASNRWAALLSGSLARLRAGVIGSELHFGGSGIARAGKSFVFVLDHPADPDLALGWIGADLPQALPGLARKLPHYGKYSYLAFEGDEPTNTVKGQWPAVGSPLVKLFQPQTEAAPLPDRAPLARPESVFSGERLQAHVRALAAPEMEGRGVGTEGVAKAAGYIAERFQQAGLQPGGGDGTFFHSWSEDGGPDGGSVMLRNVIGVLPGTRSDWEGESVVVAAHYDHLGFGWPDARSGEEGKLHPGADDNASGVAVLLELAALLGGQLEPQRTVVFVAFSGEEWGLRGSRHYTETMQRWPVSKALAAVNLDSVGHLGDGKILVLGSGSADEWVHINRGIGFTTGIESQSVQDDLGSSDQKSFLDAGIPAVQIFTGPHAYYHRPSDTPETLDYDGLVKVATFVREAVVYLSERDRPLTSRLATQSPGPAPTPPPASASARRVSLGTMPDFTFAGPGVRVDSVLPGSPAEAAGLQPGDLLLTIDGKAVENLRGYSDLLKSYSPGDTIQIEVSRGGETVALKATLKAR